VTVVNPVPVFNFLVAVYDAPRPGLRGALSAAAQAAGSALLGGFSEVSGLNAESELEEWREGGRNVAPHKFIKYGRYPTLVLKRGVTFSAALWDWHWLAHYGGGPAPRKNGLVILTDRGGVAAAALPSVPIPVPLLDRTPVAVWQFTDGLPEKLVGPALNAKGNDIAIESLEIVHEGLIRLSPVQVSGALGAVGAAVTAVL
jgi:phage tail-like protein